MNRLQHAFIIALLTLMFMVVLAPASLVSAALQQGTHHQWDLADARGTLWDGQGALSGRRDKDTPPVALPTLGWKLARVDWRGLRFALSAGGQPAGQLQVGWSGWQAQLRGVGMEARDITPLLPGLLNKGDWQGFVNVRQLAAQGGWRTAARVSQADVQWLSAATGLMPQGELGTFAITAHAEEVGMSFSITSQDGPLRLSGQGRHSARQGLQFSGELIDQAGLASRFPGFLSAYLQPAGEPRRYAVQISQLNL